uniref:Uncharacterized protein n=1 Tax=Anopheles albimanus TaxID=7167 RepID=A0A182FE85_ANOAL
MTRHVNLAGGEERTTAGSGVVHFRRSAHTEARRDFGSDPLPARALCVRVFAESRCTADVWPHRRRLRGFPNFSSRSIATATSGRVENRGRHFPCVPAFETNCDLERNRLCVYQQQQQLQEQQIQSAPAAVLVRF